MSTALRDALAHPLTYQRNTLVQLLDSLDEDQLFAQAFPGSNHAVWIMGHIAWADDFTLQAFAGTPSALEASFTDVVQWKTTCSDDRSRYPDAAAVRAAFDERRAAVLAWWNDLDPARLTEPVEGDFASWIPTLAALPGMLAGHESMHAGQLTVVRKHLGLAPVMA